MSPDPRIESIKIDEVKPDAVREVTSDKANLSNQELKDYSSKLENLELVIWSNLHDINNFLTSIYGYFEIFHFENLGNEDFDEEIEKISKEIQEMGPIPRELQEFILKLKHEESDPESIFKSLEKRARSKLTEMRSKVEILLDWIEKNKDKIKELGLQDKSIKNLESSSKLLLSVVKEFEEELSEKESNDEEKTSTNLDRIDIRSWFFEHKDILEYYATKMDTTGTFKFSIEQDEDISVGINSHHLFRILQNLVINARHALKSGGNIKIRTSHQSVQTDTGDLKSGEYAVISVEDDGAGMSEETKSKIFEPFFTTKGKHGTGLGLANVKELVGKYEGSIVVHTQLGKGTTFEIYLPEAR